MLAAFDQRTERSEGALLTALRGDRRTHGNGDSREEAHTGDSTVSEGDEVVAGPGGRGCGGGPSVFGDESFGGAAFSGVTPVGPDQHEPAGCHHHGDRRSAHGQPVQEGASGPGGARDPGREEQHAPNHDARTVHQRQVGQPTALLDPPRRTEREGRDRQYGNGDPRRLHCPARHAVGTVVGDQADGNDCAHCGGPPRGIVHHLKSRGECAAHDCDGPRPPLSSQQAPNQEQGCRGDHPERGARRNRRPQPDGAVDCREVRLRCVEDMTR